MMHSLEANKAVVRGKEQIGIGARQTGECIKSNAIDSYEDRGGKARLREELNPVDVMKVGHIALNYSPPSNSSHLYT
jgi:hypothetical protein